jgi:hypothetical protein
LHVVNGLFGEGKLIYCDHLVEKFIDG